MNWRRSAPSRCSVCSPIAAMPTPATTSHSTTALHPAAADQRKRRQPSTRNSSAIVFTRNPKLSMSRYRDAGTAPLAPRE